MCQALDVLVWTMFEFADFLLDPGWNVFIILWVKTWKRCREGGSDFLGSFIGKRQDELVSIFRALHLEWWVFCYLPFALAEILTNMLQLRWVQLSFLAFWDCLDLQCKSEFCSHRGEMQVHPCLIVIFLFAACIGEKSRGGRVLVAVPEEMEGSDRLFWGWLAGCTSAWEIDGLDLNHVLSKRTNNNAASNGKASLPHMLTSAWPPWLLLKTKEELLRGRRDHFCLGSFWWKIDNTFCENEKIINWISDEAVMQQKGG